MYAGEAPTVNQRSYSNLSPFSCVLVMRMRMRIFGVAMLAGALAIGCASGSDVPMWAGDDWPSYQYKADHNAVITDRSAPSETSWTVDLKAKVNGGLAYSGGLIFVATFDKRLVALDIRSGRQRWTQGWRG